MVPTSRSMEDGDDDQRAIIFLPLGSDPPIAVGTVGSWCGRVFGRFSSCISVRDGPPYTWRGRGATTAGGFFAQKWSFARGRGVARFADTNAGS